LNTQPPLQSVGVGEHPRTDFGHLRVVVGDAEVLEGVGEHSDCHTVTPVAPGAEPGGTDWVTKALLNVLVTWERKRDSDELRRTVARLLVLL
jgi:hypothetical protein